MITINNLALRFTGESLFENISFVVGDKDRIGLTGKNGAGKSSMLKLLSKELEPEKGTIIITAGYQVGYLPQELTPNSQNTVWNETITAFDEINKINEQITEINQQLLNRDDYESEEYLNLLHLLSDKTDRLNIIGATDIEGQTEKVLFGLGFEKNDLTRKLTEFSSGWQMRVELAKILLQKPEIILLDEPTNHLDIESIQWLEQFLDNYYGSVILVSHDRAFLDKITKRTIEINLGKIFDYKCNYSDYLEQRTQKIEYQNRLLDNQQKEIEQIEKFVERFRYKASKSKQVQSKIKLLDKIDLAEVEEIDTSAINFRFQPAPQSGKIVFEINNLDLKFDKKPILQNINLILNRKEKIAFVGRNGEGKTTLSRIIVGELEPTNGSCVIGHNVKIGYFAQNQAMLLDPNKSVFQTIDDIAVGDIRTRIRAILGSFLFSNDDIEKKVKVLSGGEKTRLAIAKLLLTPYNLLVLDEPTNHLDMKSKAVLKSALIKFDGTLIIVSHDRDFMQGLTDKVFEFKNQKIKEHIGDINNFLETRKIENLKELEMNNVSKKFTEKEISDNKKTWEQKKEIDSRNRKIENEINKIEKKIHELENKIVDINQTLSNTDNYSDELNYKNLYQTLQTLKNEIDNHYKEWEILSNEITI